MKKELGTFVIGDATLCTGCKACELACFTVHNRATNHVANAVGSVTIPVVPRLFLTMFDNRCMPVQCKHCENAPCMAACTKGAISRIDHQVIVDAEKCIGCKDCMQACPFGAVTLLPYAVDGHVALQVGDEEIRVFAAKCDLCKDLIEGPACVRVCPHEALRIVDAEAEREEKNIRAAEALLVTKDWR